MGINAQLSDLQAASAMSGGELIYIVQGGNSRRATLTSLGARLIEADTGTAQDILQVDAVFRSIADVQAASIASRNKRIRTQFRTPEFGDVDTLVGGAYYRRASLTELSSVSTLLYIRSVDRFMPDGTTDATNGGYWLLDVDAIDPAMAGAGNGVMADDTKAWQAILDFSSSHKRPIVDPGRTYIIDGYKGSQDSWTTGEWAHGGLIVRAGAVIRGAGRGKTILQNGVDNWRCVLRVREGQTSIRHLTVDGNVGTYEPIPLGTGTTNAVQGTVRGEAIIYEGGDTGGLRIDVFDVECKNTGHYGIGVQNVNVIEGSIRSTFYSNIGGDCIDVKQYSTPNYGKNLIIDGVFTADGCGHNYVGKYDTGEGHENQAVVDVGGRCIVSNVFVDGLDSYDTGQIGNVGVRARAPVNSESREGSAGSMISGVYVRSSKLATEGSEVFKRIIGVVINDADISVSDVYVENCFWGLRAYASGDGTPRGVTLSNIRAEDCLGAASDAVGIDFDSNCLDVKATNLIADGCEIGVRIAGQRGSYSNISATSNTVTGLSATDATLGVNNISGLRFNGNTQNMDASMTPNTVRTLVEQASGIIGQRQLWQNIVSLANDASWSSDDVWMGGQRFYGSDVSGQTGELARIGLRATGASGSGWMYELQAASATTAKISVARARENCFEAVLPLALTDGVTAPTAVSGLAFIYVDTADGDLKVRFGDGVTKTITTDV